MEDASSVGSASPIGSERVRLLERFVAVHLLGRLVAARAGSRSSELVQAATLFADVSGFTRLAEVLAADGAAGAERLGARLNATFGEVSERIIEAGGDVVAFPGDAVLAIWPADDPRTLQSATARAADAALHIQRWCRSAPDALPMRIGVGAGRIWLGRVGGVNGRWKLCVGGPELARACAAAAAIDPGTVAITSAARKVLEHRAELRFIRDSSHQVLSVRTDQSDWRDRGEPDCSLADIESFVPEPVQNPLGAGPPEWIAEFRRTTVVFVNVGELDFYREDIERTMSSIARSIQEQVCRLDGFLSEIVTDDKGTTALCVWGTPGASHEDDARRGVEAALAIRDCMQGLSIVAAVGVGTGRTFCGVRGGARRREYAVIGDRVNLAARLMQAARPGILVDSQTRDLVATRFTFSGATRLSLKGQPELLDAYRPESRTEWAAASSQSLFGRNIEQAILVERLHALRRSAEGGAVIVEGEAGIGKSHLVADFAAKARRAGVRVMAGGGDSMNFLSPYFAWRPVIRALLGPSSHTAADLARLTGLDTDSSRLPLLAPLLNAQIPDNNRTRGLTGAGRVEATGDLVAQLLGRFDSLPLVFLFEDVHWFDSASWVVLRTVRHGVPRALFVLTMRPVPAADLPRESHDLLHDPAAKKVALGPLDDSSVQHIIELALGVSSVPPPALEFVRERGAGHPLICEQLALALRDGGFLKIAGARCDLAVKTLDLADGGLPRDVEGLVTRRIDELSPRQLLTVKVASVIGPSFEMDTLRAVFPVEVDAASLHSDLDALAAARLLHRDAASDRPGAFAFAHALTREAIYSRLPYGQRRDLHARTARYLERRGVDDPTLLAHHFAGAGETAEACRHAERAGTVALHAGANREAAAYFQRALSLAETLGSAVEALRRASIECNLGVALYGVGRLRDAADHLTRALDLLGQPTPVSSAGWTAQLLGEATRQLLLRVMPAVGAKTSHPTDALETIAIAAQRLSENYLWEQKSLPMLASTLLSVNSAERARRLDGSARSYAMLGFSLGMVRMFGLAESYFERADRTAQECADVRGRVFVGYSQAVYLIGVARWAKARACIDSVMSLSRDLGDPQEVEMVETSLANLEYMTGDFEGSAQRYRTIATSGRRRANIQHEAWGLYGEARSLIPLGHQDLAEQRLREALTILKEAPEAISELICHGLVAQVLATRGSWPAALESARAAAALIRKSPPSVVTALQGYAGVATVHLGHLAQVVGHGGDAGVARAEARQSCRDLRTYSMLFPIGWPRTHLAFGCLEWLSGRKRRGVERFRRSLSIAQRLGLPYEQALAWQHLAIAESPANAAQSRSKMAEFLTMLGAVEPMAVLSAMR